MNEERILKAIGELSGKIDGRMDEFDKRLEAVEKKNRVTVQLADSLIKHQRKQADDIDELFRRIDELCRSDSAIWRSRDGREVAIDKQAAYDTFRDCGYGRREALRLIDAAGRIAKDRRQYAKPVRVGDEIRRAIVIFEKE